MALTSMFKLHAPSPPLAAHALLTVNTRTIFDKIKFHLAGNLAGIIFGKMAPNGCKYKSNRKNISRNVHQCRDGKL